MPKVDWGRLVGLIERTRFFRLLHRCSGLMRTLLVLFVGTKESTHTDGLGLFVILWVDGLFGSFGGVFMPNEVRHDCDLSGWWLYGVVAGSSTPAIRQRSPCATTTVSYRFQTSPKKLSVIHGLQPYIDRPFKLLFGCHYPTRWVYICFWQQGHGVFQKVSWIFDPRSGKLR